MAQFEEEIMRYEKKMNNASTMTDLLLAMSAWQSFADSRGLSDADRTPVDSAYLKAEARLMENVSKTPW